MGWGRARIRATMGNEEKGYNSAGFLPTGGTKKCLIYTLEGDMKGYL